MIKYPVLLACVFFLVGVLMIPPAWGEPAPCGSGRIFNPVTDVCWQCAFPIKIGGIPVTPGTPLKFKETPTPQENQPVCVCPKPPVGQPTPGIPVSAWAPSFLIETVTHPFCFPTLGGMSLPLLPPHVLRGTSAPSTPVAGVGMAQVHKIDFPLFKIMKLPQSAICLSTGDIGMSYMSEVDALWQNDLLAFLIAPEVLLFAFPPVLLSCMADAVASSFETPLDPLFWCAGTFGPIYPLTGHYSNEMTEGHALAAARTIFKLSRMGAILDEAFNICSPTYLPIWVKSHYKVHLSLPVRDITCHGIGASTFTQNLKVPSNVSDLVWTVFSKKACCSF